MVRLTERNGGLGGSNDLDLGDQEFSTTVRPALPVTFSGNNGRVVYTATIGVSA